MGDPKGFMKIERSDLTKDSVQERVKHYGEFQRSFSAQDLSDQAARCMDCGVPFCQGETGCPTDNLIPEFNDLAFKGLYKEAIENLHSTNNFPEFTGRLCPAPCESACVLGITDPAVSIKAIERSIVDMAWENGYIQPQPARQKTGNSIAVAGSGPAGLAAAQQLARSGHSVTVFEREDRLGGLLRYGIPDFKMSKSAIDRRIDQMRSEGVVFRTSCNVGVDISLDEILDSFDAFILAIGAEQPRELPVKGRDLKGVHFAMEYLVHSNRKIAGDQVADFIDASGKNVVVIGGGDTGSDCIGTANRQGAKSITQMDYNLEPPEKVNEETPWPLYPHIQRTSSSQEEGVDRQWQYLTKQFVGDDYGNLTGLNGLKVIKHSRSKIEEIDNSEFLIPAELVFIATGYIHPFHNGLVKKLVDRGLDLDSAGNIKSEFGVHAGAYKTNLDKVYSCGDARRGQSLIVWAISEGRKCAAEVHRTLKLAARN
jgi:glutamate synthase (NADPH) small chain